ncbi:MAG: 3-deoxy-D-manno-octulosonic acid transferase, partial [Acidobacteriota bacterium]|nr:3-deoxy-D-manno-octulosonic acid transferase [Acidobacteriota bacterium]
MYLFYSLALGLALLLAAPWWLIQMARHGKYRAGLRERLGGIPPRLARPAAGAAQRTVWLHAVSVGEVLAVSRLVEELRRDFDAVYVSTTTASGQKLARERFGEQFVFYFPLDFAFTVRAWLRVLRPQLVVLAETEFWPNFLRLAKASGAKVAVVNARISDRSLPGYRHRRSGWLIRPALQNVDLFLAQTEEDAARLHAIGAPEGRVQVSGNLKYDVRAAGAPGLDAVRLTLRDLPREHIIVAGSTVEGEDELVLAAFREVLAQYPHAVLILAPRHPERFPAVATLLQASGLPWVRRSDRPTTFSGGVLLLDTVGELAAAYGLGTLAFVGGSLVPRGGHNILEPAQHGAAVLCGPHSENFRELVTDFERAGALRVVDAAALGSTLLQLMANAGQREA